MTSKKLTMLSLFSGAGSFDLAAERLGIVTTMMSEVEPFPIAVTRKRFPNARHLGDICRIDGGAIPSVDIVAGGFCCQDLSTAGHQLGIHAARSGLFFQLTRIVREMMAATNGASPAYICLENVPGLLSSGKGGDFREVLDELAGLGFVTDANILDGQEFGVAQRRKRVFIACINRNYYNPADFAGAPKVRDKRMEKALTEWAAQGDTPDFKRETFYGIASRPHEPQRKLLSEILEHDADEKYYLSQAACLGILRRVDARGKVIPKLLRDALETQAGLDVSAEANADQCGNAESNANAAEPMSFNPGATARLPNGKYWSGISPALLADSGDNAVNLAIPLDERNVTRSGADNCGVGIGADGDAAYTVTAEHTGMVALSLNSHPNDSRIGINEDGLSDCLCSRMGTGGGNVPLILNERAHAAPVDVNISPTLTACDFKGAPCLMEENKAFGICSQASNAMQSANPASGVYEADTSKTLDTSTANPNKNGGGMVVLAVEGNLARPSHKGVEASADGISYSLNTVERHQVCYQNVVGALDGGLVKQNNNQTTASGKLIVEEEQPTFGLDRAAFNQGKAALYKPQIDIESTHSLTAQGPGAVAQPPKYVVRRLTPTECLVLMGLPINLCDDLGDDAPTEDKISFWADVWETHRRINGTSSKPKSRNQLLKWIKKPYSDSAAYKLCGNSLISHVAEFVLKGFVDHAEGVSTII